MSVFSSVGNSLFGVPNPSSAPYAADAQAAQTAAQQYQGREAGGYTAQQQLADSLWNTVNGKAPSVADIQLQQALGQELAQNSALGAGATGTNSVLARYLAATNANSQASQAAQSAALLRAKETEAAQQQLGNVTGAMENESAGLYGTNLSNGLGYNNLANSANQANASRAQTAENMLVGALGGAAGGLGSLGASYFKSRNGGNPGSAAFVDSSTAASGGPGSYTGLSPSQYGSLYSQQMPGFTASQNATGGF